MNDHYPHYYLLFSLLCDYFYHPHHFLCAFTIGGESIYGRPSFFPNIQCLTTLIILLQGAKFADESFTLLHSGAGILSMANSGPNRYKSTLLNIQYILPTVLPMLVIMIQLYFIL